MKPASIERHGAEFEGHSIAYTAKPCLLPQAEAQLPDNRAIEGIADAIALGCREAGGTGAAVLMVVQPGERNSYDQQARAVPDKVQPFACMKAQCRGHIA